MSRGRRGIDHFLRADTLRRKVAELEHARGREEEEMPDLDAQEDYIEDDALRLAFASCHPCLTGESRAALTLRLVGGLTSAEIPRGFLATESTMGHRLSRAKKMLAEAHAVFELPTGIDVGGAPEASWTVPGLGPAPRSAGSAA